MRVAAFSLATFLTTGCATTLPTPEAAFAPAPLSARWLDPSGRDLRFTLSQPAYTAIFDISPGAGAGLIYPGTFDRQYQRAGLVRPIMPLYIPAFSGYMRSTVASYYSGPRMLLLVASRSPLRLEGLYTAGGMRRLIGSVYFASYFPQETLERVLHGVLPVQADDDWDADVLVIWPQDARQRFVRPYRVLVCEDRTTFVVPITYLGGCARDRSLIASAPSSGGIARPIRDSERRPPAGGRPRAPRPVDERAAERPGGRDRPTSEGRPDREREVPARSSEPRGAPSREAAPPRERTRETGQPRDAERPDRPTSPRQPR
jgi:hypothetical protein